MVFYYLPPGHTRKLYLLFNFPRSRLPFCMKAQSTPRYTKECWTGSLLRQHTVIGGKSRTSISGPDSLLLWVIRLSYGLLFVVCCVIGRDWVYYW
ncbi:hypothetical protein BDV36DRAFT_269879 [Aspergillus pseudocaelatus]|uniref:Uncharacterized protein n=1 Tax=Aspergillus pseudocaelatus TaxID=1825620 RepID=A0ABQ6W734_9EURO|nr:hypothetical protein BDV36DRAFT_269879 [Aspergillus pseudocaelatus]